MLLFSFYFSYPLRSRQRRKVLFASFKRVPRSQVILIGSFKKDRLSPETRTHTHRLFVDVVSLVIAPFHASSETFCCPSNWFKNVLVQLDRAFSVYVPLNVSLPLVFSRPFLFAELSLSFFVCSFFIYLFCIHNPATCLSLALEYTFRLRTWLLCLLLWPPFEDLTVRLLCGFLLIGDRRGVGLLSRRGSINFEGH